MANDIYAEEIIHHYHHPQNKGVLAAANASARDSNPLCGDDIQIQLKLDASGRIAKIAFDGNGCAISQASASMLTELAKGKTPKQVLKFSRKDVEKLLNVPLSPVRVKCAMLSLKVLKMASCVALGADPKKIGWEN